MSKKCHLCGRKRGRRACPALGHAICAACCGTKRLVEINCPTGCSYLLASQSHPPAAVQRQRERDIQFLFPLLQGLTEPQQQLVLSLQHFLIADRPDDVSLVDEDVEHAARALADTYETASRGIIYDHGAALPSAERLGAELKTLIEKQRAEGLRIGDAEVAATLRTVERGARQAGRELGAPEEVLRPLDRERERRSRHFLQMLKRVLGTPPPGQGPTEDEPRLIVPG